LFKIPSTPTSFAGIKYIWGKANRYFFSFADSSKCLVARGSQLEKGDCSSGNALTWGIIDGQMSQGNGKMCIARLKDNSAALGMTIIFAYYTFGLYLFDNK
jgi:hypothetical protein